MAKCTVQSPACGAPIQLFKVGEGKKHPRPGYVVTPRQDGKLDAGLLPGTGGGSCPPVRSVVRHVSDPEIDVMLPQLMRSNALMWDFCPSVVYQQTDGRQVVAEQKVDPNDTMPSLGTAKATRLQEGLAIAEQMARDGQTAQKIQEKVRFYGLKSDQIEEIVRDVKAKEDHSSAHVEESLPAQQPQESAAT